MPTKLILIRHAETDWNSKKKYCGLIDIGISKKGKAQAQRLCERLQNETVHKVYVSDRKRAIQTAGIVFKGIEIEKVPNLRELCFGVFEGLSYKDIIKRHPVSYKKWLRDPFSITIPQGENLRDFENRVINAFKKIISLNKNKTVAVVSHGGAISIFINNIIKSKKFWKHIPKSASLSIVEHKHNKIKLRLFNDITHLQTCTYNIQRVTEETKTLPRAIRLRRNEHGEVARPAGPAG